MLSVIHILAIVTVIAIIAIITVVAIVAPLIIATLVFAFLHVVVSVIDYLTMVRLQLALD